MATHRDLRPHAGLAGCSPFVQQVFLLDERYDRSPKPCYVRQQFCEKVHVNVNTPDCHYLPGACFNRAYRSTTHLLCMPPAHTFGAEGGWFAAIGGVCSSPWCSRSKIENLGRSTRSDLGDLSRFLLGLRRTACCRFLKEWKRGMIPPPHLCGVPTSSEGGTAGKALAAGTTSASFSAGALFSVCEDPPGLVSRGFVAVGS